MNEFLQSLRSGKDKRFDRTRRTYDGNTYRPHDRSPGNDRRKKPPYKSQSADQALTAISKILPSIQTALESIATERKEHAAAEIRKARAMEQIASYLSTIIAGQAERGVAGGVPSEATPPPVVTEDTQPAEAAAPEKASVESEASDAILQRMQHLRDAGRSYEAIARQLEKDGIPTPSGRGKWRGQAVSKLLKKEDR